jgi:hypothetical protein
MEQILSFNLSIVNEWPSGRIQAAFLAAQMPIERAGEPNAIGFCEDLHSMRG